MDIIGSEKNKSMRSAKTAQKLTEMLRDIDISSSVGADGEYSAVARLTALFDHGSFSRIGAYINRSSSPDEPVGVICGYGSIGGRLAYAFAEDRTRMGGAFDESTCALIDKIYSMAARNGAPIIGIFDSNGLNVYEGVRALAALGRTLNASASVAGIVPKIALVPGVCGGCNAVMASSFDFLLSVKPSPSSNCDIYAVSKFVSGAVDSPSKSGIAAFEAEDEARLYSAARALVEFLPQNNAEGYVVNDEVSDAELQRSPDLSGLCGESLIAELADAKNYFRLWADYAPEVALALATVGGVSCAVVASERSSKDGALTVEACRAIAKLERFADTFRIPFISFVDSPGFDTTVTDNAQYLDAAAALSDAVCFSSNPKISAVIGRAYGPSFIFLASKSVGYDISFATPDACISALSPEASVAFVWNDKVRSMDLTSSREMLELEWREKLASPNDAALCGEIDDIIPANELRPRIVSAIRMLLGKSKSEPSRRKR